MFKKTENFSLKAKILIFTIFLITALGATLTVNSIVAESERILTTFTNSARKTAQFISNSVRDQIKNQNLKALEQILSSADVNPNISRIQVTDRVGLPLYGWNRAEGLVTNRDKIIDHNLEALMDSRGWVVRRQGDILRVGGVLQSGEEDVFGYILITFGLTDITSFIASNRNKTIIITVVYLIIMAIVSYILSTIVVRDLNLLSLAARKIAGGDYSTRVRVKTKDEIGELATNFNLMANEISNLLSVSVEKARMESELNAAKLVQEGIFPSPALDLENFAVRGSFQSANECGGDWWHHHESENQVYLWIGDATGHGVPSALITSVAKTISIVVEKMGDPKPAEVLALLNDAVTKISKGQIFMTFFLAAIDKQTGKGRYSLAAHEPPLILPSVLPKRDTKLPLLFRPNNNILGLDVGSKFVDEKFQLKSNECLFAYTDGLVDAFGTTQDLRRFVFKEAKNSPNGLNPGKLVKALELFVEKKVSEGMEIKDDITYFTCYRNPS